MATAIAASALVLGSPGAGAQVSAPEVVADGLDNPRGLTIAPNGTVWVAEAGVGGSSPACIPAGPPANQVCYGTTGALTVVTDDGAERVLDGLPSLASTPAGLDARGPQDLAVVVPDGYVLATEGGQVLPFGDVSSYGDLQDVDLAAPVLGVAQHPTGMGYWLVAADGGVFSFGEAAFYGSTGGTPLNQPVVGMASTPSGMGYWLVAADGGVFSYGDAAFYGSTGNLTLNQPVVGMASTPSGMGYWLVAADGGVFSYGDAAFYGSTANLPLVSPVVAMAAAPDGEGYWLVAADGGVFNYGSAPFYGAAGGVPLAEPVVGLAVTALADGYRLFASDGGVFDYGTPSHGSGVGEVGSPVVGGASPPATVQFVIGLGGNVEGRAGLPGAGARMASLNVVTGRTWTTVTDLLAYEAAENPDAGAVDTNPYSLLAGPNVTWVADAGGNDLVAVVGGDAFDSVTLPFLAGGAQPVPTSIAVSPDGDVYVGQLTGFPFTDGAASVYRVVPAADEDEPPTLEEFETGFTNIIDIAFGPDGSLYVLEIDADGLATGDPTVPNGQLLRIDPDGIETVVDNGLASPGSVVVDAEANIFVSTCGNCGAGQGEVWRYGVPA